MRWNGCRAASASASVRCKTTTQRCTRCSAACGRPINLAGVRHEDVLRGQELATPGYLVPSRVLTVRLHCLADMKRPIKHRLPVRFHVGTSEIMGTVSLLDCDAIEPGQWGLAQLFLDEPATATWGQPFVVRESSATQTLGGGQVLAARGPQRFAAVTSRCWSGSRNCGPAIRADGC